MLVVEAVVWVLERVLLGLVVLGAVVMEAKQ